MALTGIIFYKEAEFAVDTWFDLTDSDYLALEKAAKNTNVFNFASNVSILLFIQGYNRRYRWHLLTE